MDVERKPGATSEGGRTASDRQADEFKDRLRLDLKLEAIVDPSTGEKHIAFLLDPARYEIKQVSSETVILDLLDNIIISLSAVRKMVEEAWTRVPTGQGQRLGDGRAYIASRREVIGRDLEGASQSQVPFVDRSEEFLEQLPDGVHRFAVLSLDLVHSTRLSVALDPLANARITGLVLRELAAVVPFFNGHILKFTGDGVLAYFPTPSFLTANDNAIDCSLTMRGLILDALNPNLIVHGFPILSLRIGIESGAAIATTVGHSTSKLQRDLIGQTINIACKIQGSSKRNEIRIGGVAYRNMHTMWKRGCQLVRTQDGRPFSLDGTTNPIYMFSASGAVLE
jgi:class 3 adenylate cyclase